MDWFDFFFGMFVGAAICEEEYENNRNCEECEYYDEDTRGQFVSERRYFKDRIY